MIKNKIIYIDIDDTLCYYSDDNTKMEYGKALPYKKKIKIINELYENNKIILWTARGTVTKIDWKDVTTKQLEKWNVKYHKLKFGKPAYDILIDDKALNNMSQLKLMNNLHK